MFVAEIISDPKMRRLKNSRLVHTNSRAGLPADSHPKRRPTLPGVLGAEEVTPGSQDADHTMTVTR
jgi:hypothetical protein